MFKLKILFYWLQLKFRGTFRSRKELEQFQRSKLQKFERKVLTQSPYYSAFAKNEEIVMPKDYPIINKEIFVRELGNINTVGIESDAAMEHALKSESIRDFSSDLNGITVGLSTGTSGKRSLFFVSQDERAAWVAMVMHRVVQPRLFRKTRVAFFLRADSNLYSSVQSALFEFKYFDIFRPLEELKKELNEFSPHVLAAQPSVLLELATDFSFASPELIISFAEVLDKDVKEYLIKKFDAPLREVYQCTEGFLGVTCVAGVMHLNEDVVLVEKEMLDQHRFVPIITDFSRKALPVVRYRLDDVLEVRSEPCSCGSSLLAIENISGRVGDILTFKNGSEKFFSDMVCRRISLATNDFVTYQLIQHSETLLELKIDADKFFENAAAEKMSRAIYDLLLERHIHNVEIIIKQEKLGKPGAKFRRVISKCIY